MLRQSFQPAGEDRRIVLTNGWRSNGLYQFIIRRLAQFHERIHGSESQV